LYWVGEQPDTGQIEGVLESGSNKGDLWLGAHTHAHPDDELNGRSHIETKWGVNFINVAPLTRWHMDRNRTGYPEPWSSPMVATRFVSVATSTRRKSLPRVGNLPSNAR
jgi:hypothetical protein